MSESSLVITPRIRSALLQCVRHATDSVPASSRESVDELRTKYLDDCASSITLPHVILLSSLYRALVLPHCVPSNNTSASSTSGQTKKKKKSTKKSTSNTANDNDTDTTSNNTNDTATPTPTDDDITMDDLDCGSGWVHELIRGSSPAINILADNRPKRDPKLDVHLAKLRYQHERREYQQLVKNMPGNRSLREEESIGQQFSKAAIEMSIGLNMIVLMATGFIVCWFIASKFFPAGSSWPVICGAGGLVFAMMVEMVLFLVREAKSDIHTAERAKIKAAAEKASLEPNLSAISSKATSVESATTTTSTDNNDTIESFEPLTFGVPAAGAKKDKHV